MRPAADVHTLYASKRTQYYRRPNGDQLVSLLCEVTRPKTDARIEMPIMRLTAAVYWNQAILSHNLQRPFMEQISAISCSLHVLAVRMRIYRDDAG